MPVGALTALLNFFRRNSNEVDDLDHYCRDCIYHFLIWCQFNVYLEPSEKSFYALEHLNKSVLIRADILSCLKSTLITMDRTKIFKGYTLQEGRQIR